MNVIDFNNLMRDPCEKPASAFSHPALGQAVSFAMAERLMRFRAIFPHLTLPLAAAIKLTDNTQEPCLHGSPSGDEEFHSTPPAS